MDYPQMGGYSNLPVASSSSSSSWASYPHDGAEFNPFPLAGNGQSSQGALSTREGAGTSGVRNGSYKGHGNGSGDMSYYGDPRNSVALQTGGRFEQLLAAKLELDYPKDIDPWTSQAYQPSPLLTPNPFNPAQSNIPSYEVEALLYDLNQTQIPPDLVAPLPPAPLSFAAPFAPYNGENTTSDHFQSPGQYQWDQNPYYTTPQTMPFPDIMYSSNPLSNAYHSHTPTELVPQPKENHTPHYTHPPAVPHPPSNHSAHVPQIAGPIAGPSTRIYQDPIPTMKPGSWAAELLHRQDRVQIDHRHRSGPPSFASHDADPSSSRSISPTRVPRPRQVSDKAERKPSSETEERKVIIACNLCRARKLKCDGTRPRCHNCTRRDENVCVYQEVLRRRGPGKKPKKPRSSTSLMVMSQGSRRDIEAMERVMVLPNAFVPEPGDQWPPGGTGRR